MDITNEELNMKMDRPAYYEDLGRAHDCLLRCKDCHQLVTYEVITKLGMCPGSDDNACGNRRFTEIKLLNEREMEDIKSGKIDFPNRDLFLAEFAPVVEGAL